MALQVSLTEADSAVGVAAPNAYARIVVYTHGIKTDVLTFAVEFHYNQQARNQNRNPIKGQGYAVLEASLVTAGNIRMRMYNYLKTLPQYAGAVDV